MFITFDGIDGGGKSTQLAQLCDHLRGHGYRVLAVRDPGGTAAGEAIRSLLLDSSLAMQRRTEALLFMAARSQLVQQRIRPALADGQVVVSDRFLLANVVYQSIANGKESGDGCDRQEAEQPLGVEELWQLGQWAIGGLRPDLTLLLDLPVDAALARLDRPADRMESRGAGYLAGVRQAFLDQLARSAQRTAVINAAARPDQVQRDILAEVQRILRLTNNSPPP